MSLEAGGFSTQKHSAENGTVTFTEEERLILAYQTKQEWEFSYVVHFNPKPEKETSMIRESPILDDITFLFSIPLTYRRYNFSYIN
jgi:hypothetical protein